MKYIKGFMLSLITSVLLTSSQCKTPQLRDDFYIIKELGLEGKQNYKVGDYYIFPTEKRILKEYVSHSSDRFGMRYELDSLIDFDSTKLVFEGNRCDFIEYLNRDLNTLKLLNYDIGRSYDKRQLVDKNTFYNYPGENIDISGMERLNDYIYRNESGTIVLISKLGVASKSIWAIDLSTIQIDWATLKHVVDDCFMDKDKFFYFKLMYNKENGRELAVPIILQSVSDKSIKPQIEQFYIVYGNNVYLRQSAGKPERKVEKLDLDGNNLKKYELFDSYSYLTLLTDGKNKYIHSKNPIKNTVWGDLSNWKQLTKGIQRFTFDKKTESLYYTSYRANDVHGCESIAGALFYNEGLCFLIKADGEYFPVKNVYIAVEGLKYEKLEADQYTHIASSLYIYKNMLYTNMCVPIPESKQLKLDELQPLTHDGIATNYLTDGNILFYHENIRSFVGYEESMSFSERSLIKDVDFKTLSIVNKSMLVDKNNIYTETTIIPRSKLGVEIIVVN